MIIIIIILAFALAWKTKKLFNYIRLVGKMPFFLRNSFLTILMLISRKLVQRRGTGEKCVFFRSSPAVTKRLRSKRVRRAFSQRSIFSSWLGHAHKFLLQTIFFSNVCKSLDIPHILVSQLGPKPRTQTSQGETQSQGEWPGTKPSLVLRNSLRTHTNFRLWSLFYNNNFSDEMRAWQLEWYRR